MEIGGFDSDRLEAASYDFRVGPAAAVTTESRSVNLREQPLIPEPYSAALVLVEETIKLSKRMLGRLGAHSKLFRCGIFASIGPQIDPGYSGRMRVSLLNMTEHPFLIKHKTPFITAEFHYLSEEPAKTYSGPPGEPELTEDEINQILGRGGPSLKDIQRLVAVFEEQMGKMASVTSYLQGLSVTRLGPVPLTSLEPGRYELTRDIPVVLQPSDDGFTATFFDANIASSGDTEEEAIDNLRTLIVDTFELLESVQPERLGRATPAAKSTALSHPKDLKWRTKSAPRKSRRLLKARMHAGSAHDIAVIEYEGKIIAEFGIRRGSRKDQGHGFIPGSIHLNLRDTLSLAQCALSYDQWVQRTKDKGVIEAGPDDEATS